MKTKRSQVYPLSRQSSKKDLKSRQAIMGKLTAPDLSHLDRGLYGTPHRILYYLIVSWFCGADRDRKICLVLQEMFCSVLIANTLCFE